MTTLFTICATNYLAFARQLGESVLAQHPEASFTIWLLDRGALPALPQGFRLRYVDELLSTDELERLSFYYELIELATAVKPLCFRRHFEEDAASVIYLDPDIVLFRPLTEVAELLEQGAAGVLTPHIMAPLPQDAAIPDDLVLLQAGVYNLGFLALSRCKAADELLEWWWGWLRTQCFADKLSGTFTDQKWLNFAPVFWPQMSVLRDPSYNVAYWNLAQRSLEATGDGYAVDGRPLTFFHFSGFDPERPGVLSKHQTRIDVGRRSPLAALLEDYARRVLEAGHLALKTQTPPPVTFRNGIALDPIARVAFREAVRRGIAFRDPRATGIGSFFNWLIGTVPRDLQTSSSLPLSRYLITLYDLRGDVRSTYPDVFGADRQGFLAWAAEQAVPEMGADPELIRRLVQTSPAAPVAVADQPAQAAEWRPAGVRLVGYLRAALGLGEAARGYARAMQAAGIPLQLIDVTRLTASPIDEAVDLDEHDPEDAAFPINVLHVNADQLLRLRDEAGGPSTGSGQAGGGLFEGCYNIGVWAWETQEFPEAWHDRFDLLQEIWVPSAFIADAIGRVSPLPTVRIPHVIEVPHVAADRRRFGLGDHECVFLFHFDFHSTAARKNPRATLDAFRRAFAPGDPVRLVLKSINGRNCPGDLAELKRAAAGLPVTFIDEALDGDARFVLLASCDCFVSLHRAEGFGLGMAEAMALGKPVIATGWSGNMDYMTPHNSFPVDYRLLPLARDAPPYPAGTIWAEPDVDHAALLMRRVRDDPEAAREIGRRARQDIEAAHSPALIGGLILERLRRLHRRGRIGASAPRHVSAAVSAAAPPSARARSWLFRGLRRGWRFTLRVAPTRYHPRLHRLTSRLRGFLAVG